MAPALAAQRATEVLRHVARHPGESFTLTALADRLGIGRAAMHGVLTALVESGFLERDDTDKSFRLGPESVVLGSAARAQLDDVAGALAAASRIADRHPLSASVLARRDDQILVLDGTRGPDGRRIDLEVPGQRVGFAAPFGALFASRLPHHQVVAWFQRAGIDPASELAERYRAELARIGDRGWSVGTVESHDDPIAAWEALVGPDRLGGDPEWCYLVDDLEEGGRVHPTVVVVECGIEAPHGLAVAVTGFERSMDRAELHDLAAKLVRDAID